jgi:hypothetical protein
MGIVSLANRRRCRCRSGKPKKPATSAMTLQTDPPSPSARPTWAPRQEATRRHVIAKLGNCASVKLMLITGHTDRIGSHEANQKLSEKRAEAVKAYLVSKGAKADSDRNHGRRQDPARAEVRRQAPRKKLIECLAPNRRVVVEVQGPAK